MATLVLPIGRTGLISRLVSKMQKIMKKTIFNFSTLAVAALALFSCARIETEIQAPEETKGVPFEIYAGSAETKTSNADNDISWVADDAINLFHAEHGATSYGANDKFTISSANLASNKFTGTLSAGALDPSKSYDWYAMYPYDSHINTPNNTSSGYLSIGSADADTPQVQDGNNSMAHLSGQYFPLYGKQENVDAADAPSLSLKPALSVIKIRVTNKNTADLTVNSIAFVATEAIVGQYYIKFIGDDPVFTGKSSATSKTARLSVTSGSAIAQNAYADFYIAIKPFTAAVDSKLTIVVNGFSKTVTVPSEFTFAPGKVTKLDFNYSTPAYDQLVYTSLGISGSTYTSWSGIEGTYSNAVYAGQSFANDNNYIQIRAQSPSGIVSTTSGGKVTKVSVIWNASTIADRKVTIYGKNTPYSGPSDLYSDATRGTSLGEIVMGTSTELTVSGYYEYVGILSDNAVYIDEVDIYWGAAKTKIAAPTGVSASESSGGTITVTWTDVLSGVAKYIVTCTGKDSQDVLPGVQAASFSDLYNGNYTVTIQAVPTDTESYSNSEIVTIADVAVTSGLALPVYTLLTSTATGTNTTPHNSYSEAADYVYTDGTKTITWNVTANSYYTPWRFGGKQITDTDRVLYSKTALSDNIKKIEVVSADATITVNSLTISVHNSASDASTGDNAIASKQVTSGIIESTVTFNKADDTSWAGKFYRIVYNVSNNTKSNKYVSLSAVKFYTD